MSVTAALPVRLRSATAIVPGVSILFWLWYWIVHQAAGPLFADELSFSHILWLIHRGERLYLDFYEYHPPVYFWLLSPLVGDDLSYIYAIRLLTIPLVGCYLAMTRPIQWPFVLIFVTLARMSEIRPDTFGLLLMNGAWFLMIKRRPLAAAIVAGLSLLFSARAAIVIVGFGIVWLLVSTEQDRRRLFWLAIAVIAAAALALILWSAPIFRALQFTFFGLGQLTPQVTMATRFLEPPRLLLVVLTAIAASLSLHALTTDRRDRVAIIVLGGAVTQLILILVDPAPFGYVYGWSMIPVVTGLAAYGRRGFLVFAPAVLAAMVVSAALLYPLVRGSRPHTLSLARLSLSTPFRDLDRRTTPQLIELMMQPQDVYNAVPIRRELCRRVQGTVEAYFWYQPICLPDANYEWLGISWSALSVERTAFERGPALIIWGDIPIAPRQLPKGYRIGPGFATLEGESPRSPQP